MKSSTRDDARASVTLDIQLDLCDRFIMRRSSQVHEVEFPFIKRSLAQ